MTIAQLGMLASVAGGSHRPPVEEATSEFMRSIMSMKGARPGG